MESTTTQTVAPNNPIEAKMAATKIIIPISLNKKNFRIKRNPEIGKLLVYQYKQVLL